MTSDVIPWRLKPSLSTEMKSETSTFGFSSMQTCSGFGVISSGWTVIDVQASNADRMKAVDVARTLACGLRVCKDSVPSRRQRVPNNGFRTSGEPSLQSLGEGTQFAARLHEPPASKAQRPQA